MLENIRKKATLAGLFFFITSTLAAFLDVGSDSEVVVNAIKPFTFLIFGEFTILFVGVLALIYFLGNFIFYFLAWKNYKSAIWVLASIYLIQLLMMLAQWGLEVQMGLTNYLGTISSLADGAILCCLLLTYRSIDSQ